MLIVVLCFSAGSGPADSCAVCLIAGGRCCGSAGILGVVIFVPVILMITTYPVVSWLCAEFALTRTSCIDVAHPFLTITFVHP